MLSVQFSEKSTKAIYSFSKIKARHINTELNAVDLGIGTDHMLQAYSWGM